MSVEQIRMYINDANFRAKIRSINKGGPSQFLMNKQTMHGFEIVSLRITPRIITLALVLTVQSVAVLPKWLNYFASFLALSPLIYGVKPSWPYATY